MATPTSTPQDGATERLALMTRFLEEALKADTARKNAFHAGRRKESYHYEGRAQAYYHAARLAGWRPESLDLDSEVE